MTASDAEPRVAGYLSDDRDQLVRVAFLLTGDADAAQDVVHDVIATMLGSRLGHVTDLRAYARRCVVNAATSRGRRLSRALGLGRRLRAEWHRLDLVRPDPYGSREVVEAIHRLPERQRTVVVLRHYLDLPDTEIADVLACAPATVRSIHSRALRRLRADLTPEESA